MERRGVERRIELRDDGGDIPTIVGYAAVFYRAGDSETEYKLWDGAVERIMPSAFARISEDDVRALRNHDANALLGRTASGTLALTVDDVGLRYEIKPKDTRVYRDTVADLRSGDMDGSSFSFVIRSKAGVTWSHEGQMEVREVKDVLTYDVGPVTFPAYAGTSSGLRAHSVDDARKERAATMKSELQEHELRKRHETLRKYLIKP